MHRKHNAPNICDEAVSESTEGFSRYKRHKYSFDCLSAQFGALATHYALDYTPFIAIRERSQGRFGQS